MRFSFISKHMVHTYDLLAFFIYDKRQKQLYGIKYVTKIRII